MWREACRSGMAHTALGVLTDLFCLWDATERDPNAPATPEQSAALREDLMQMVGDTDGRTLAEWRRLWLSDPKNFSLRAAGRVSAVIRLGPRP